MTAQVSNRTKAWQEADRRHHIHPFTVQPEMRASEVRVITGGEGIWLIDSEGNRILDGMAGLWCVQVGYGNKELADAGYEALKQLPYYNTFFKTTNPYVAELCEALEDVTPDGMSEYFFANSGSESNDTGIKMVRYYWNLMNQPKKKQIIARRNAYHGSTVAAGSLTGLSFMHGMFDMPMDTIHHVDPMPFWYRYGGDMTESEFAQHCAQAIEDKIVELGPENVGAFIGEPIMGAAGMIPPPEGYWPLVEAICRKYDVLFWFDEVICGFGRTGNWFGCETYGVSPDMMTVAKGITSGYQPLSALMLGTRMAGVIAAGTEEFAHGYTYSGHPVACAVALRNIGLLKEMGVGGDAFKARGQYFTDQLQTLADHPIVGEVRSVGFLGGIELSEDKEKRQYFDEDKGAGGICRDHCVQNNLVMRASGDSMILSPPLVISHEEIDELVSRARHCLDLTAKDLGVL